MRPAGSSASPCDSGDRLGGLGAAPPVLRSGGAVASPRLSLRIAKKPGKARPFFLSLARVSGCGGQDGLGQRAGVFRPAGDALRARISLLERDHLGFFDGLLSSFKAMSKATSETECRADHVGI